ncbi:unnamed protein product [Clonostachys chloroleuca]|uniref:Condensation domain-containing protein n=1 Tax=Clonostachys chloroleuca TaxID=1926264 RepID=A0AA35QBT2_9HYPO|nr:unnamed protein product [Clonostachys chloroleuca]CAI6099137.1 unnamed protein product [Clonostachys chloroleuca]
MGIPGNQFEKHLRPFRMYSDRYYCHSKADKIQYWKNKLAAADPTSFPAISNTTQVKESTSISQLDVDPNFAKKIQAYCEQHSITAASLFQSAWALTLGAYSGATSVCFGYLVSGRDLPVPNISETVGAFANMMICYADVSRSTKQSCLEFVANLHTQVIQDLDFQHCSLADIHHALDLPAGKALFNSIMSFQKSSGEDSSESNTRSDIRIESIIGEDPTEYDVAFDIAQSEKHINISLEYRLSVLSDAQAARVLSFVQGAVDALIMAEKVPLGDVYITSTEDLHDIWRSITRFGTTHIDLTASTAQLLPTSVLESLDTMILDGERSFLRPL